MKKVVFKTAFAVAAVAMLAASCTKQELRQEPAALSNKPIEVRSYSAGGGTQLPTKSAIFGSTMPTDRDLVISAYYNDPEGSSSSEYFKDYLFSYSSEKQTWTSAEEPVYWPLKGTLDFLAYSSEDAQISAQWDADNCASEVILGNFKESLGLSDDLFYAKANGQTYSASGVPMEFSHAKSLIVFTAKSSNADAITIKKIEINGLEQIDNSKTQLTITNNGSEPATAEWNKEYKAAADVAVPGIDNISYNVPVKAMDVTKKSSYLGIGGQGIMVPEQEMKSFTVYFEQNGAAGSVIKESFTYDCKIGEAEDTEWKMGKRYIYELNFKVNEIEVSPVVVPWDDEVDGIVAFDDSKFEAYCLANFDADGDGMISYKEAALVTSMEFDTNGMDNLIGIEHFSNLQILRCPLLYEEEIEDEDGYWHYYDEEGNEIFGLKSLDVSKNVNLLGLDCCFNRLHELDLSNNTKLMQMGCAGSPLGSLDLSNNTFLSLIVCPSCKLKSINLGDNASLIEINCFNNQLETLDISKSVNLEILYCERNLLTSLDVSNNTKLRRFECQWNNLSNLDITKNTELERFKCNNNKLTSLDLSKNAKLGYIDCSNNLLSSLDVSNNLSLADLYCYATEEHLEILYMAEGQVIDSMMLQSITEIVYK